MQLKANPVAAIVSQFLMKAALPLGLFFIVEYAVSMGAASNALLAMLRVPLMVVTPVALYVILRRLRDNVLSGMIGGLQAWIYGVQLMLFAALIEAAFIYVYNEFIVPGNLETVQQAAIAQYEQSLSQMEQMPSPPTWLAGVTEQMRTLLNEMSAAPTATPIQAAINQVSSDLFIAVFIMLFVAPMVKRRLPQ